MDDFLSPTEKTVLVKRLAIAVMLIKGNDYNSIRQTLKVTPVTISKISLKIAHGNGSVKKTAINVAESDYGKALIEEFLGIFEKRKVTLTGEVYKKSTWERRQKIKRLKKGV